MLALGIGAGIAGAVGGAVATAIAVFATIASTLLTIGLALESLNNKPPDPSDTSAASNTWRNQIANHRNEVQPRQVVYGRTRVGMSILYINNSGGLFTPILQADGEPMTVKEINYNEGKLVHGGREVVFSESLSEADRTTIRGGDTTFFSGGALGYGAKLLFKPNEEKYSFSRAYFQEGERAGHKFSLYRPLMYYNSSLYGTGWDRGIDIILSPPNKDRIRPSDFPIQTGFTMGFVKTTPQAFVTMTGAIAGHPIDAVEKIFIDDDVVVWEEGKGLVGPLTDTDIAFDFRLDGETPLINSGEDFVTLDLAGKIGTIEVSGTINNWFPDPPEGDVNLAKGCALVRITLHRNPEAFKKFPEFTFQIRGKKVKNLETGVTEWTKNPSYILADVLKTRMDLEDRNIDKENFIEAAHECDRVITYTEGEETKTRAQYETSVVFNTEENAIDSIIPEFGKATNGIISTFGGVAHFFPGRAQSPILNIDENDIISLNEFVNDRSSRTNKISSTYQEQTDNYRPRQAATISNEVLLEQDGIEKQVDPEFRFVNDHNQVQQIASVLLARQNQSIKIDIEASPRAFHLLPGDVVNVSFPRYNITNQLFKVEQILKNVKNFTVRLLMTEENPDAWDWRAGSGQPLPPNAVNFNTPMRGDFISDVDIKKIDYVFYKGKPRVVFNYENLSANQITFSITPVADILPDGPATPENPMVRFDPDSAISRTSYAQYCSFDGLVVGQEYILWCYITNRIGSRGPVTNQQFVMMNPQSSMIGDLGV